MAHHKFLDGSLSCMRVRNLLGTPQRTKMNSRNPEISSHQVPRQAKGHIRFKIPKHLGDNTFLTYILQLHVTHHVKMEDALIIQPIQRNVIVRLDGKGASATKRMEVSKRQLKSN